MTAGIVPIIKNKTIDRSSFIVESNIDFIRATSCLRKYTKTASSVPKCTINSKDTPGCFTPRRFCTKTRWPEDEIGRNSVKPWIMPRIIASIYDKGCAFLIYCWKRYSFKLKDSEIQTKKDTIIAVNLEFSIGSHIFSEVKRDTTINTKLKLGFRIMTIRTEVFEP